MKSKKGAIDVNRPGTSIVLTPTLKNAFGYTLDPSDLIFYFGTGKSAAKNTSLKLNVFLEGNGSTAKPSATVTLKITFS